MARDLDFVLFGATGFTGQRAAELWGARAEGARWAVAGRDPARLELVRSRCGASEAIVCDQLDRAAVGRVVERARVVASTAGPFTRIGDAVVDACVEHGAHYVDITGETAWARRVIDRHHARARQEGTRIVPFCGFDSVPADLLCLRLARRAREELGEDLAEVSTIYRLSGGLNGGTLATALEIGEQETPARLADPWLLVPDRATTDPVELAHLADARRPLHEPGGKRWVVPFFMGAVNSRVVLRSHALADEHPPPAESGAPRPIRAGAGVGYGAGFRYREYQRVASGFRWDATLSTYLLWAGTRALRTRIGRRLVEHLGPRPGHGPDERDIEDGRTRARAVGRTESGCELEVALDAVGDPGNIVTTAILVESARILVDPPAELGLGERGTGGVLTPALAFGELLLARLARAGFRISELPVRG